VVGILGSAFYDPVRIRVIHSKADFGLALAAFGLLPNVKVSPVIGVVLAAFGGRALSVWTHLATTC